VSRGGRQRDAPTTVSRIIATSGVGSARSHRHQQETASLGGRSVVVTAAGRSQAKPVRNARDGRIHGRELRRRRGNAAGDGGRDRGAEIAAQTRPCTGRCRAQTLQQIGSDEKGSEVTNLLTTSVPPCQEAYQRLEKRAVWMDQITWVDTASLGERLLDLQDRILVALPSAAVRRCTSRRRCRTRPIASRARDKIVKKPCGWCWSDL